MGNDIECYRAAIGLFNVCKWNHVKSYKRSCTSILEILLTKVAWSDMGLTRFKMIFNQQNPVFLNYFCIQYLINLLSQYVAMLTRVFA
jgi:hypothetical protein